MVDWWRNKDTSGGQIVEQTIHQFDIIRYVFDEPEMVYTMGTRGFVNEIEDYNTDDLSTTVVRFRNGALAAISTGCYATSGDSFESKIVFSARDARAELRILSDLKLYGYEDEVTADEEESEGFVEKGDGAMSASSTDGSVYKQDGDTGILCDRTFNDAALTEEGSKIQSP